MATKQKDRTAGKRGKLSESPPFSAKKAFGQGQNLELKCYEGDDDCCESLDGMKAPNVNVTVKFKMDGSGFSVTIEASHACGIANYTLLIRVFEAGTKNILDKFPDRKDFSCKSPRKSIKEVYEWGAMPVNPPVKPLGINLIGTIIDVRLSVGSCCHTVEVTSNRSGLF
jgi:hypothetical protein